MIFFLFFFFFHAEYDEVSLNTKLTYNTNIVNGLNPGVSVVRIV